MAKKVWVQAQLTVRVCFEVEGVMPREGDPLYPSKAEALTSAALNALHEMDGTVNGTLINARKHRRQLARRGTPAKTPISFLLLPPHLGMEVLDVSVETYGFTEQRPRPLDEQQQPVVEAEEEPLAEPQATDDELQSLGAELGLQLVANRPPVEE